MAKDPICLDEQSNKQDGAWFSHCGVGWLGVWKDAPSVPRNKHGFELGTRLGGEHLLTPVRPWDPPLLTCVRPWALPLLTCEALGSTYSTVKEKSN